MLRFFSSLLHNPEISADEGVVNTDIAKVSTFKQRCYIVFKVFQVFVENRTQYVDTCRRWTLDYAIEVDAGFLA